MTPTERSEREVVAEAIYQTHRMLGANWWALTPRGQEPWLEQAEAAIAALDAHRQAQPATDSIRELANKILDGYENDIEARAEMSMVDVLLKHVAAAGMVLVPREAAAELET